MRRRQLPDEILVEGTFNLSTHHLISLKDLPGIRQTGLLLRG